MVAKRLLIGMQGKGTVRREDSDDDQALKA
jgi:hypothetical protein